MMNDESDVKMKTEMGTAMMMTMLIMTTVQMKKTTIKTTSVKNVSMRSMKTKTLTMNKTVRMRKRRMRMEGQRGDTTPTVLAQHTTTWVAFRHVVFPSTKKYLFNVGGSSYHACAKLQIRFTQLQLHYPRGTYTDRATHRSGS